MKSFIQLLSKKCVIVLFLLTASQLFGIDWVRAQAPDCSSGTVMYALFADTTPSTSNTSPVEIRPVNYSTGVVGSLMGGTTFPVFKTISGTSYYGSSSLGVDGISGNFFTNTTMGFAGGRKDFYAINTATNTMVRIGTTSTAIIPTTGSLTLSDYFFVKMAISPTGMGYAIGVARDTTLPGMPGFCNPLIRFTTCGTTPTSDCSTIEVLGFFPSTGIFRNWNLFNGDLAFDNAGNLYYMSSGYARINGNARYTDVRLLRVNAANIPTVAGAGVIPTSFLADYNTLDSTVVVGNAFDPLGSLFIAARRYNGVQNLPLPTYNNQLYRSTGFGSTSLMPGFVRPTVGYSFSDLASCFFPLIVLADNKLTLSGKYNAGRNELIWQVNDNTNTDYFEVQSSDDGENFNTITRITSKNKNEAQQTYSFNDSQNSFSSQTMYRIRQHMTNGGLRFYSNVININFHNSIKMVSKPRPNPFISSIELDLRLKFSHNISFLLKDRSGRNVYQKQISGHIGDNKVVLDGLTGLPTGLYILEVSANDQVVREKIIKQ
jgi:hypothetical protein